MMNKDAKIYIAGHTGLVGSALIRALTLAGYNNLITCDFAALDLRRQQAVEDFFAAEKPEYVFLAAAKVGGIHANNTYKAEFIYDNLMIAANVIYAAHTFGVKKLLNLGSSCIYPKNSPQPLQEEYLLTSSLEATNEPYAIAKIAAIKLCRYYNEQYGTNFISVMPTNLYGYNDNFNLETSHVLPAILRKLHLAKLLQQKQFDAICADFQRCPVGFNLRENWDGCSSDTIVTVLQQLGITAEQVILWGSGNGWREFLFADDLADAVVFLMQNSDVKDIGELINIGIGQDITIYDLAVLIADIVEYKGVISFNKNHLDGTARKLLDITKLERLGWQARVGLRYGIMKVYENYCAKG